MADQVRARAHANLALSKYWGKHPGGDNVPATPSLSLAVDKLLTETAVRRIEGDRDRMTLNGEPADKKTLTRISSWIETWRKRGFLSGTFEIESVNHFPTAAGLASSSSGYAALTAALSAFTDQPLPMSELSRMARRGSASAARSIPGGIAQLPLGEDPESTLVMPADEVPWGMVVAAVKAEEKEIGSTEGMNLSRQTSPLYHAWLRTAEKDFSLMLEAVTRLDLEVVGEIAEANMYAMHSVMLSTRPALLYWNPVSLALLNEVRRWRQQGIPVWATVDAGPHVIFLTELENLEKVTELAGTVPGVDSVFSCNPAGGAEVVS